MTAPTELSKYFSSQLAVEVPRLAISVDALDKCGKSFWSLMTPPEPILVVSNDPGTVAVFNKAKNAGRKVSLMEVVLKEPDRGMRKQEDVDRAQWALWIEEWNRVKAMAQAVARDKTGARTIVVDTATMLWELAQLAHFGKLQGNVRQDRRTELNADFHKFYWDLYKGRPDLNIILIHKLKKVYIKNSNPDKMPDWSGEYERAGFNNVGFWVDLSLRMGWDSLQRSFYSEIDIKQPTRFGSELCGKRWYGQENSFVNLALEVFPSTAWGDPVGPEWWGVK